MITNYLQAPYLLQPFWRAVLECLIQFHQYDAGRALATVKDYYLNLKLNLSQEEFDFIQHEEPFAVACEIAGKDLDISAFRDSYQQVLFDCNW